MFFALFLSRIVLCYLVWFCSVCFGFVLLCLVLFFFVRFCYFCLFDCAYILAENHRTSSRFDFCFCKTMFLICGVSYDLHSVCGRSYFFSYFCLMVCNSIDDELV